MAKKRNPQQKPLQIKIEYKVPDDIQALFADAAFVTRTEDVFVLSFVQLQHPLVTDPSGANVDKVEGKCVSRVVLSPRHMERFVRLLQDQFKQFLADLEVEIESSNLQGGNDNHESAD